MKAQALKGSYNDYLNKDYHNKTFTFRLLNPNGSPTITSPDGRPKVFVGLHSIEAFSIILEKQKDSSYKERVIRYIEGQPSIYKDEQSEDDKIPKKKYKIPFKNGFFSVKGSNYLLLDYMMKDNKNMSNPNRDSAKEGFYELIDTTEIIKKQMDDDKVKADAVHFCYYGDFNLVVAYARVLNQRGYGINLSSTVQEIRWDMKRIAEKDPVKFMEELNDPTTVRNHIVLEAIERKILVENTNHRTIAWANNPNQPIFSPAIQGQNLVEDFVQKTLTTSGEAVYQGLFDIVDKIINPKKKAPAPLVETKHDIPDVNELLPPPPENPLVNVSSESKEALSTIIAKAIESGIVVKKKPMWLVYKGQNYKKEAGLIEALEENPTILHFLKEDLGLN
jgi:hypothetical protein